MCRKLTPKEIMEGDIYETAVKYRRAVENAIHQLKIDTIELGGFPTIRDGGDLKVVIRHFRTHVRELGYLLDLEEQIIEKFDRERPDEDNPKCEWCGINDVEEEGELCSPDCPTSNDDAKYTMEE